MSLHPQIIGSVPEETARVACAAFPKGTLYLQIREELGIIYEDSLFSGGDDRTMQVWVAP